MMVHEILSSNPITDSKPVLTDEVPAASRRGAADPLALEQAHLPLSAGVVRQRVRRHVTDLHCVVVLLEVLELHPGRKTQDIIPTLDRYAHLFENDGSSCKV